MKYNAKYQKAFSLGIQKGMEYRSDFFLKLLSCFLPIFIQLFMWKNIYGHSKDSVFFGYNYSQMIAYTLIAIVLSKVVKTGFEYEICDDIKNGGLDKFIVRPLHYIPYRLFSFLGQKIIQLVFLAVILSVILFFLNHFLQHEFSLLNILLFIPAVFFALVLNFIIFFSVSLSSFWLSEVGFFFEAVYIVFLAFSGGIFPLDIFGGTFMEVLQYLPFKYTINFPVDILNGRLPLSDILSGLAVQIIWSVLMGLVTSCLWTAGTKKYIAAGG